MIPHFVTAPFSSKIILSKILAATNITGWHFNSGVRYLSFRLSQLIEPISF